MNVYDPSDKEPLKPAANDQAEEFSAETAQAADALSSSVQELRSELEQAKDRALRCQAELDNYRKRASRELHDQMRYANIGLMRELLPVLDNIDRALEAAEKTHDAGSLLEGVKLIGGQLREALARHHCTKIEALHEPFDPHFHQAILQQPSAEYPPNTVILVTQDGYKLHDRVVRPSHVIVSTEPKE